MGGSWGKSACSLMPTPISANLVRYPDRIIAFGTITRVEAQYSEFKVLETFEGSGTIQPVIKVWDEKDFECNGLFPMGSEMLGAVGDSVLLIAPRIVEAKNPWDVVGDHRMPFFHTGGSLFNFKTGTVWYSDTKGGVASGSYSSAEMKGILKTYLGTVGIHGRSTPRKQAFRFPGRLFIDRDVNGRSRP